MSSKEKESMLNYHSLNNILLESSKGLKNIEKFIDPVINNVYQNEMSVQYKSNGRGLFAQCMVTGAVLILTIGVGMPIGYSAILLPQLSEKNSTINIDESTGSWIASIHSLASPIGALLSGPLVDAIGRRSSLQLSAIPMCVGWLCIGFASNLGLILVGRFAAGFGVGMSSVAGQILIGETSDAGTRGFLLTTSLVAYCAGILLVYILGATLKWNTVAFCGIILPSISLILLGMISESPVWLIRHGKTIQARKTLIWLRGGDISQVNEEMSKLEMRAKEDLMKLSLAMTFKERVLQLKGRILDSGFLKPLLILNIFFLLQVLSGTYLIVFYGVDLIRDIGKNNVNSYWFAVIIAFIRFIFCILSCILLLKVGRRTLAIVSSLGTAFFSIILAAYIFTKIESSFIDKYIIGACAFMYVSFNSVGLLTLPSMMVGELLPIRVRGIGGGITMCNFQLSLFTVAKIFPMVKNFVGMGGVFLIFGIAAVLESLFTWLMLPETKNRSLQEIEDYFNKGNILWIKNGKNNNKTKAVHTI